MQTVDALPQADSSLISKHLSTECPPPKPSKRFQRGHWKRSEQERYIAFLRKYYYIMRSSQLRFHFKIFNVMAVQVGTRSSAQCKSHHQKMLIRSNYCLEQLIVGDQPPKMINAIKDEQTEKQCVEFKKMAAQVVMDKAHPYLMVQTGAKLLIVIDDRFVECY